MVLPAQPSFAELSWSTFHQPSPCQLQPTPKSCQLRPAVTKFDLPLRLQCRILLCHRRSCPVWGPHLVLQNALQNSASSGSFKFGQQLVVVKSIWAVCIKLSLPRGQYFIICNEYNLSDFWFHLIRFYSCIVRALLIILSWGGWRRRGSSEVAPFPPPLWKMMLPPNRLFKGDGFSVVLA